jgi:hypothetical protein
MWRWPMHAVVLSSGNKKNIFIIAMTGDREKFLEAGMNAKPVQVAELKKAQDRVAEKSNS